MYGGYCGEVGGHDVLVGGVLRGGRECCGVGGPGGLAGGVLRGAGFM